MGWLQNGWKSRVVFLEENDTFITARHDGYKQLGLIHTRTFAFSCNELKITDTINGKNLVPAVARIHFHPDVRINRIENGISIDSLKIEFLDQDSINFSDYLYASQYNTLIPAVVIEITFTSQLNSIFHFN